MAGSAADAARSRLLTGYGRDPVTPDPSRAAAPPSAARWRLAWLPVTIFGVPWDELALEHVESFLADAGGEGLTWEAKGTELPHPGTVAKHVCGFANAVDGGYLLLGAARGSGAGFSELAELAVKAAFGKPTARERLRLGYAEDADVA
jgi:hypothetical protein